MKAANPDLFAIASKYFPSTDGAMATKRMVRLTRTQLDLTTKTLLPAHVKTAAMAALPPDPLQTNYEYAANLSFTPANFTPYTKWVEGITASVRANPASVIDCAASSNGTPCLQTAAKAFVGRAVRGTLSDAQLTRYADMLTTGVTAGGPPRRRRGSGRRHAQLAELRLPRRGADGRVGDAAARAAAAADELHAGRRAAGDGGPVVRRARRQPRRRPTPSRMTVDRLLATPEARAKLMRFFVSWLEVKEPAEFTIAPSVFPEFTPALAAAMVEEAKAFLTAQLSKAAPTLKDVTQSTQSFVSDALASIYGVSRGRHQQADAAGSEAAARDLHAARR